MNAQQTRRKDKGLPGNGGRFASPERAEADPSVGLGSREKTPAEKRERLRQKAIRGRAIREDIRDNPTTPEGRSGMSPDELEGHFRDSATQTLLAFLYDEPREPWSEEELLNLSRSGNPDTRAAVAAHPDTTAAILELLKDDPDVTVRFRVAGNQNASADTLYHLSKDSSDSVRGQVALFTDDPETQLGLASDDSARVRRNLTENPNTSSDALDAVLLVDRENTDPRVMRLIAKHKNVSPRAQQTLFKIGDKSVHLELARNESTVPEVLHNIAVNDASDTHLWAIVRSQNVGERTLLAVGSGGDERLTYDEQILAEARNHPKVSLAGKSWRKQYDDAQVALRPYVVREEGFSYIADNAPADQQALYQELMQTGYAKGWL